MLPSREITLKMLPNGQTFPVQHMEMLETALDKHCPNTLASDTRYRYHWGPINDTSIGITEVQLCLNILRDTGKLSNVN